MKLSSRETFLLMMVLAVALCAGYYNYVYTPVTEQIAAGESELLRLEAEHNKLLVWQAEVPQTELRLEEVQEELDGWVADAKAVADAPQVLLFLEAESATYGVRISSIRISARQASFAFTAPNYIQTRLFLQEMERMMAFEVTRARYSVPAGAAVDGSFDVALHIGAADPSAGLEPVDKIDPFSR